MALYAVIRRQAGTPPTRNTCVGAYWRERISRYLEAAWVRSSGNGAALKGVNSTIHLCCVSTSLRSSPLDSLHCRPLPPDVAVLPRRALAPVTVLCLARTCTRRRSVAFRQTYRLPPRSPRYVMQPAQTASSPRAAASCRPTGGSLAAPCLLARLDARARQRIHFGFT